MSRQRRKRVPRQLVGGEVRSRGGLLLPGHLAQRDPGPKYGVCHTCGKRFYAGEEEKWQRHVGDCARANLDEVQAAREARKSRLQIFQEESWDPELAAHFRKVGDRMLREGRLTMRRNERSYD